MVIPTYNERDNVDHILSQIESSPLARVVAQLVFVDDDSPDDTAKAIRERSHSIPTICLQRIGRMGLSSALIEGLMVAQTPFVAVMDADGQHSPQDLLSLANAARDQHLDLVIGVRQYPAGVGSATSGPQPLAQHLTRLWPALLGRRLQDPLSNLFVVSQPALHRVVRGLKPVGSKLVFDMLTQMKGPDWRIEEMPVSLRPRHAGRPKLDWSVYIELLDQIVHRLSKGLIPERFLSFAAVGGSGVVVHFSALYTLVQMNQLPFWTSQALATLAAMTSNYTLNNEVTFRRLRRGGKTWPTGLALFVAFCSVGAIANVGIASALFAQAYAWWLSALAGVVVGAVFNFSLAKSYVWRRRT